MSRISLLCRVALLVAEIVLPFSGRRLDAQQPAVEVAPGQTVRLTTTLPPLHRREVTVLAIRGDSLLVERHHFRFTDTLALARESISSLQVRTKVRSGATRGAVGGAVLGLVVGGLIASKGPLSGKDGWPGDMDKGMGIVAASIAGGTAIGMVIGSSYRYKWVDAPHWTNRPRTAVILAPSGRGVGVNIGLSMSR